MAIMPQAIPGRPHSQQLQMDIIPRTKTAVALGKGSGFEVFCRSLSKLLLSVMDSEVFVNVTISVESPLS